ncbi:MULTISPECIES: hypothetical protein [Myroides]|uniref:Uncharacterized protein n=1 Tax=Myroides odoratimimus CIP 101113 TaxID=883154 RepID=A0AAV3F1U6_9FLAO|nr:hypothetical protein [Myroides odoratimimus]EHO09552.1 hypothetical protein HMPREF9715_02396 [Myroides odoratimimus CIP 101113]MDM1456920.1 hypothetical protein [Myroides odoratimimus]
MKKANQQVLHALLSSEELACVLENTKDTIQEDAIFNFLLKNNVILQVDVNQANLDSDAISFLIHRMNTLGEEFIVNEKKLDKKVSKAIKKGKIQQEDSLSYMINQIRKKLPKSYTIFNLERGDEAYYIGVIKKKELKKLSKLTLDFGIFHKFTSEADKDPFYVINCSCGATFVWEIGQDDTPPTEGTCHNCGKSFFNDEGQPINEMKREKI